jgi:hypothetical protein
MSTILRQGARQREKKMNNIDYSMDDKDIDEFIDIARRGFADGLTVQDQLFHIYYLLDREVKKQIITSRDALDMFRDLEVILMRVAKEQGVFPFNKRELERMK